MAVVEPARRWGRALAELTREYAGEDVLSGVVGWCRLLCRRDCGKGEDQDERKMAYEIFVHGLPDEFVE